MRIVFTNNVSRSRVSHPADLYISIPQHAWGVHAKCDDEVRWEWVAPDANNPNLRKSLYEQYIRMIDEQTYDFYLHHSLIHGHRLV